MKKYKKVLSIAGSDSGGGAGIQADIKAISACGCYAMTAITAVTVQNTVGVRGFHVVPAEVVAGQIAAVLEDIGADAVKLGMLPTDEMIVPIAESLKKYRVRSVVMDPVMVATSGDRLISEAAAQAIRRHIFPLATLVTPNVPEAEYITGMPIRSEADFPAAAAALRDMGAGAVLLKAGHLDGTELTEYLFDGNGCHTFRYPRTDTPNTHGTGCTLSSAVAAFLAQDYPLEEAVLCAENYVHEAIVRGREYRLGNGHGPVHHFIVFGSRFPEE
ncbi:bifunctional hydroxymethylpyrimidine kinase/phosphomethylpyrimidine kinase [Alistipes sp. dk3620]|uniref:bifunctional hydroxymethylpyrimidine kinase/phosphomethylpyrimidine kinase n=1 Tax=unclassified Alistipes TaxID=2608932 RepID=UPI001297E3BE|nr:MULTISPECIES: bifunctional hydroxymethylpyrimidine kinase/phosphomethylpyrimidine kinase [unclassified Alistipes]MQX27431.1 bifunctional hydroxymethylpyrimidine kinase/phosphomethylpyrimidine kinase [Alistipes sp. dk3620]QGA22490.1 bifunctional hydroxymethylpyrimidine kinase/phosphomethylpyrimidine kinase [Alistipes sp. dk3624]